MIPHVNDSKNDAIDEVDSIDYVEKSTKIKWLDWLLLNRPLKVITVLSLATVVAPLLIYQFMFFASYDQPSDAYSFGSCLVSREARLPCGIEAVDPESCHNHCCYDYDNNMCFHRFPSRFSYITEDAWTENTVLHARIPTVPYKSQNSFSNIKLSIDEISATHLSLTFYQSEEAMNGQRLDEKMYSYNITRPELSVAVNSTQGNIFNTFHGPIIASENIWEITFKITEESMYGLGEIPLKEGTTKILYNHDGGLTTIPLIFGKSNVSYHGLLIDTVNPTEVIVRSDNQLVIRSITNKGIKLHLFVGPKPADVMRDVIDVIGVHKDLDYWSLGVHVCTENASDDPLTDLNTFITTARTQGIPFESHCGLAPVVFDTECDNSQVALINQGAATVKNAGKRFVPHVSPYIRYTEPAQDDPEESIEKDQDNNIESRTTDRCFNEDLYKSNLLHDSESNEAIYIGEVNNNTVIYPNYDSADEGFIQHLWLYSTDFDGLVLENNWPLDDRYKHNDEIYNALPYFNEYFEGSFNHTLKWNATRITKLNAEAEEISHEKYFYTHNEYGNEQVKAFEKIKGPVPILSTSIWMNGNVTLNKQKIPTSWSSLHKELIDASLGGVSGLWYWSSPICGDTENFDNTTQIRLCAKWYMAATYMPMVKIHSKEVRRDPLAFIGTDNIHMTTALTKRMSLLPYFYTVLQEGPLLRPMFYQFPETDSLKDISTQFAVGDFLLIVPNLLPTQTHVHIVMPPGIWFEMWSGLEIKGEEGEAVTMSTTESDFLTLIHGGSILAIQKDVRLTTDETRLHSPYSLIIALDCKTEDNETNNTENIETTTEPTSADDETNPTCEAKGKLYMTENVTINFEATYDTLKITATEKDLAVLCNFTETLWANIIGELSIYGLDEDKNNYDHHKSVTTNIDLCTLRNDDEIVIRFLN